MPKKAVKVADLFKGLAVLKTPDVWGELADQAVKNLRIDSRKLEAGDIFIAVRGFETDGHAYLPEAKEKGALLAVVEEINNTLDLPQVLVSNSRSFQADLASRFYGNASRALKLCGITGSNGKTTTSLMYRNIIETAGYNCGLIGTVSYEAGNEEIESHMTTPDSIDLQGYFRDMVDNGIEHAVMEISSIGIHQHRPKNTDFDVIAFINLGREHLDYHGSMEAYFAEKRKVLDRLVPGAVAILNQDDEYSRSLADELACRILRFGTAKEADVRAENIDLSTGFAEFDLLIDTSRLHRKAKNEPKRGLPDLRKLPQGRYPLKLKVPGYHSVYNALAAISAALAMGAPLTTCITAIEKYGGVERRFQEVYAGEYRIFDDHFANGKNIDMTLETLSKMDYKNLIMAYAIRGKRGVTVNRENITALNECLPKLRVKAFVATRSKDTVGHYDEVLPEEEAVFVEEMKKNDLSYEIKDRLEEAIDFCLQEATAGDIILLAGCQGMDAGARIALHKLAEADPENKERILAPLQGRVCGW